MLARGLGESRPEPGDWHAAALETSQDMWPSKREHFFPVPIAGRKPTTSDDPASEQAVLF